MAGHPIAALADDLTGAAEIAAIGNCHGLPTRIFSSTDSATCDGLAVHDSDSRLLSSAEAAQRVSTISRRIAVQKPTFVFKKTDSVLRGNVVAEVVALAKALNLQRVLLVPANPSLGRTISNGQYFIQGTPINETSFAKDPHHPAKSSNVADLLGPSLDWPVNIIKVNEPMPDRGIIVGEATSSHDVSHWASRFDAHTLPAGGAEFFQACLKQLQFVPKPVALPSFTGPALVITGSLTPAREKLIAHATAASWPVHTMPASLAGHREQAFSLWLTSLTRTLADRHLALTQSPKIDLADHATSMRIRENFAEFVKRLLSENTLNHLVVEGGATAAAISETAGWTSFDVVGEWATGVIALRPTKAPQILFTIKPGSYTWPEILWRELDAVCIAATKS